MTATLYVEGGGEGRSLRSRFRQGWRDFLRSGGVDGKVKIVRGGGREQTFDRFATAVASAGSGTVALLLVDSEEPVAEGHTVWRHLAARDGWTRPDGVGDDQAFLMVQVMETWFLADRDALRTYFGAGARQKNEGLSFRGVEPVGIVRDLTARRAVGEGRRSRCCPRHGSARWNGGARRC